jgi:hypothetical protein
LLGIRAPVPGTDVAGVIAEAVRAGANRIMLESTAAASTTDVL